MHGFRMWWVVSAMIGMTALAAVPASAATSGTYSWTLDCNGDGLTTAGWNWTAGGQLIPGAGGTASCVQAKLTGGGDRPANADGFVASLVDTLCGYGYTLHGSCGDGARVVDSFDPASSYKTNLGVHFSGQIQLLGCYPGYASGVSPDGHYCIIKVSGGAHFTVDS